MGVSTSALLNMVSVVGCSTVSLPWSPSYKKYEQDQKWESFRRQVQGSVVYFEDSLFIFGR